MEFAGVLHIAVGKNGVRRLCAYELLRLPLPNIYGASLRRKEIFRSAVYNVETPAVHRLAVDFHRSLHK